MMDDILKQIKAGEVSGVQFKERVLDKYDIACELVAFSNSHGGKLVVGIKDKTGDTNALSYSEVQETTNLPPCELLNATNSQAISYLSRMRSLNCTPDTSPAFICFNISSIIL